MKIKHSNDVKSRKLEMPLGTASGILRKSIMFHLAQKLKMDMCYRCSKIIESVDEFSIEHKTDWQNSKKPIKNFFDVENIAFSHLSCNCAHSRRAKKQRIVGKSRFKGVTFIRDNKVRKKRWRATIFDKNSNKIACGHHLTAKAAALAYDKMAIKIFGKKAITNKKLGSL